MGCVECGLPINKYKQNEQIQDDLCEFCHIVNYGSDDLKRVYRDIIIDYNKKEISKLQACSTS